MFRWGGGSCIQNSKFEYKKTLFILTITRLRHLSLFTDLHEDRITEGFLRTSQKYQFNLQRVKNGVVTGKGTIGKRNGLMGCLLILVSNAS